jgi:hypothetical protein
MPILTPELIQLRKNIHNNYENENKFVNLFCKTFPYIFKLECNVDNDYTHTSYHLSENDAQKFAKQNSMEKWTDEPLKITKLESKSLPITIILKNFARDWFSFEQKPQHHKRYEVVCIESCNGLSTIAFDTEDEALNHIMNVDFNAGKTREWQEEENKNDRYPSFVEEYDRKLYSHWMSYNHEKYHELFEEYTENMPKTLKDLKQFLADGNRVTVGWADRNSIQYFLVKKD